MKNEIEKEFIELFGFLTQQSKTEDDESFYLLRQKAIKSLWMNFVEKVDKKGEIVEVNEKDFRS